MALYRSACAALALAVASPAAAQPRGGASDAALERFTSRTLTPFRNDAEFDSYVAAWRQARRSQRASSADRGGISLAALQPAASVRSDASDPICPQDQPDCRRDGRFITVTGARIAVTNASITNNQMAGVEEGDIVKQIGRYLLVLSDGRIFVIDTQPGGRPGLVLADRADVYRRANVDTWYDECSSSATASS